MNNKSILAFSLTALAIVLTGCGSPGTPGTPDKVTPVAVKEAPTGATAKGEIEEVAFKGGYGIDFYQKAAEEFATKNPGLKVTVTGDPRVWEQLRPRFVGDTPPDLCFPGWGMDHWALVAEGQLLALDDALKSKPFAGDGTWGDTFEPSLLALGQQDGHQYILPYYFNVMGWWYDPGVFARNSWTVPKTFDDLLKLGDQIRAKGIAPITYQGKYPYYMIDGMLLPWAFDVGGADAVKAAQNLEPGAWKSSALLQAAKMIKQLQDKGFFQKGATAMSHTESQTEFLQGHAAMIPCGTWLSSEMKNVMPAGAKMEFMLPPSVAGGKGDASNVIIGIEPWMIPAKAKNPEGAVALFKYMTSLDKAKQFVEQKSTLMAIKGSDSAKLPDALKTPAKVFKESKAVWSVQYRQWYPAFETEIENALTSMLNGEATPEQFCDRVESGAEKVRQDSSITKHKVTG